MLNLLILFAVVIGFYFLLNKLIFKKNFKFLNVNPYIQTFIAIPVCYGLILLVSIIFKDQSAQLFISTLIALIGTMYLGVAFQRYYFKLSDAYSEKIEQYQVKKNINSKNKKKQLQKKKK